MTSEVLSDWSALSTKILCRENVGESSTDSHTVSIGHRSPKVNVQAKQGSL